PRSCSCRAPYRGRGAGLQRAGRGRIIAAMQSENRFLDDLARAASGAMGAIAGAKQEVEAQIGALVDRWLKDRDLVTRAEFDAVKAMAAKARAENEDLAARLAALEARLNAPPQPYTPPSQTSDFAR